MNRCVMVFCGRVCDAKSGCARCSLRLLQVRQTGKGCVIDASLFGSMADWMTVPLFHFEAE
eukprot:1640646-Amphidinium_carterae.1